MAKNYVCDGAKIECKLCTKPEGELKVTSNEVKIQGKLLANAKDKEKVNLIFQGNCKKSPWQALPCVSVIKPEQWQNTADLTVQDTPALLEDATIMCSYGGVPIKITDHLQKSSPAELQPVIAPVIAPIEEPMFTRFEWQDTDENSIDENNINAEQIIFIQTQNILPGETLTVHLTEKKGEIVKNNTEKVSYSGTVDSKGTLKFSTQNTALPKEEEEEEGKLSPQILEMYWMDIEGNRIDNSTQEERINLYIKVINIDEGEELNIGIDNDEGQRITYTGIVNAEGNVILNDNDGSKN